MADSYFRTEKQTFLWQIHTFLLCLTDRHGGDSRIQVTRRGPIRKQAILARIHGRIVHMPTIHTLKCGPIREQSTVVQIHGGFVHCFPTSTPLALHYLSNCHSLSFNRHFPHSSSHVAFFCCRSKDASKIVLIFATFCREILYIFL